MIDIFDMQGKEFLTLSQGRADILLKRNPYNPKSGEGRYITKAEAIKKGFLVEAKEEIKQQKPKKIKEEQED